MNNKRGKRISINPYCEYKNKMKDEMYELIINTVDEIFNEKKYKNKVFFNKYNLPEIDISDEQKIRIIKEDFKINKTYNNNRIERICKNLELEESRRKLKELVYNKIK